MLDFLNRKLPCQEKLLKLLWKNHSKFSVTLYCIFWTLSYFEYIWMNYSYEAISVLQIKIWVRFFKLYHSMVTLCINKMRNHNLFYLKDAKNLTWLIKSIIITMLSKYTEIYSLTSYIFLSFNFILETTRWDKWNYNDPMFEGGKMRLKSVNMPWAHFIH